MKKFIKNIKFLFRKKLKDEFNAIKSTQMDISDIMDNLKYELIDELNNIRVPKIMTVDETIDMLIKTNKSMARFGDGELNLMLGESNKKKKASPQLSNRLTEVFNATDNGFCVAILYALYHSKENLTDISKHFWRYQGVKFRRAMEDFIDYDKIYGAAEMTLAYSYFKNYNYQVYFDKMRQIWDKKDIVIVCGKTVFDKIETNIFDNATSIEYVHTPPIDAFEQYDSILNECLQKDISKSFILICGPTAKVLAYDLMKNNRRALDLGHIAKQYDWFKKNKRTDKMADAIDFFNPD